MTRVARSIGALAALLSLSPSALAQVTVRVSVDSSEGQAEGACFTNAISHDGRYVAFDSIAADLVSGDTNGNRDVFLRDRLLGTTRRVSVSSAGAQSNGSDFFAPYISISGDGTCVVFESNATNLVAGDTNGRLDLFLHDIQTSTTERVSVDSAGNQSLSDTSQSSTSFDGRYVAFRSYASNLVGGDANGWADIFVRDRVAGTTQIVSIATGGAQTNSNSQNPAISADGRFVAFTSYASNLFAGDTNGLPDGFVHDRQTGITERISVGLGGAEADGSTFPSSVSADGRYVAFESWATNLVPLDLNGQPDAFVRDRLNGTTQRVSVGPGGAEGNAGIQMIQYPSPAISADGRFVAFLSDSTNFAPGDNNGVMDVFLHDRLLGTTERSSVDAEGVEANAMCLYPSVSGDGRYVSFSTHATTLQNGDTNQDNDIYVRDRASSGFTSLCDPGVAGVIPCPCANPPSGPGRGCDNSSHTGGASMTASGAAYLTQDTLRFTTSGERATALSILVQWTGPNPSGAVFGMGVRCTSGTFKRLYTRNAVAGSISVPDPSAGDPTVSSRSAALGSTILAGESRWYFVYYRDPFVLGGCPATSTSNATQTGQVTWNL